MIPSSDWCKNYDTFIWLHPARVPTSSHLEVQCSWVRRAPSPVVTSHCLHHSPSVEFHVAFTLYVMKTIPKSSPFCCGCKKKNIPSHGSFMAGLPTRFLQNSLNTPSCSSHLASQRGVPIQSHPRLASSPSEKHRFVFFSGRSHVPPCSSTYGWKFARGIHHTHRFGFSKSQQKLQFRILQGPFFLIFPLEPPFFVRGCSMLAITEWVSSQDPENHPERPSSHLGKT